MALLPSGYIYSTRNNHGVAVEKIGGVVVGLSSATATGVGNPVTYPFTVKDMATVHGRVTAIRKTGNSAFNATYALSNTGTFAYEMTDWIVMRLGTTINGTANNALKFAASAPRSRRALRQKSWGAKTTSAFKAGRLSWTKISGQRSPWTAAVSGLSDTFKSTTNNGTDASDEAIYVTFMSVPGELVYMDGKRNPTTDEYEAVTQN